MPTTLEKLRTSYPNLSDDSIADLAAISLKLNGAKKTRNGFLKMVKEVEPDRPIPEIDEVDGVMAELAKRDEAIAALRKERDDDKFAASLASQKNEARSKFGLSDDDVAKMEEMMKKGELPADYRFAPQLFKMQTEPAEPTNYGTGGYGPLDLNGASQDEAFKGLMENPDNWASQMAHRMIEEGKRKGNAGTF